MITKSSTCCAWKEKSTLELAREVSLENVFGVWGWGLSNCIIVLSECLASASNFLLNMQTGCHASLKVECVRQKTWVAICSVKVKGSQSSD